jgi:hypothetical protein
MNQTIKLALRVLVGTLTICQSSLASAQLKSSSSPTLVIPNSLSAAAAEAFKDVTAKWATSGVSTLEFDLKPGDDPVPSSGPVWAAVTGRIRALETPSGEPQSNKVDVFFASAEKIENLANSLERRILRESSDNRSILTDIQLKFRDQRTPTLSIVGSELTFANVILNGGARVAQAQGRARASTLNVNETIAAGIVGANIAGLRVDPATLQLLPETDQLKTVAVQKFELRPLSQLYSSFADSLSDLLKTPTDPSKLTAYVQSGQEFRDAYFSTWPDIKNNPSLRGTAARTFNAMARQSQFKTIYGVETNFPPPSYEQIYNMSRRVVTLRSSGQNICSGFAIDKNWIVTAGHCFRGRAWSDLRVVFDLDGLGTRLKPIQILELWPNPAPGSSDRDDIDFAFVRVEDDTDVVGLISALEATTVIGRLQPESVCIGTQPLAYKEPIFAIGYPKGVSKTVHDYSYVWFPFKLSDDDFNHVDAETFARAKLVGDQYGDPNYADEVIQSFRLAYATTRTDDDKVYHYYYGGIDSSAQRPLFGIDTDTFGGDSGSPVFDRQTRCLVGIFSGGARDSLVASEASWKQHELATPITEILAWVRKKFATDAAVASAATTSVQNALLTRLNQLVDTR